jgi:hypothetical protein
MEDTQDLTTSNGELPSVVVADPENIALTPNEMRALKAATGRPMSDVFSEDNEEDAMQAVVWLALRRQGHHATWAQAGDVALSASSEPVASDPTPTDSSPTSQRSADSGE